MTAHLTPADVDRFRRGEMSGRDALDLSRHLEVCADCLARVRNEIDVDDGAASVRRAFAVEDAERSRWKPIAAMAAAVAAIAISIALLMARSESKPARVIRTAPIATPTPPPQESGYGRADWDALVADVRRSGRLDVPPAIRELRLPRDTFRGTPGAPAPRLDPMGEAVESQQPQFRWTKVPPAPYIVRVFAGREQVAESPLLSVATWTPDQPLSRDVTYAWQVEVVGRDMVLPTPPDPPALFRIIDEATANEIADARRRFPSDHLLLAALCTRAGVLSCASEELARHSAEHPTEAIARGW